MPLQETSGAASYDAFGGGAAAIPNYIEDVFSTYLYTGNGSTQTITNGIDLAGEGGLVWIKSRSAGGYNNTLYDTVRGATNRLVSNDADVQNTSATSLTSFSSTGFSLGSFILSNESAQTYASWTFRKQPKFFDVVTYTGTGTDPLTLNHNLQSVPGVIIIKCTSATSNWRVHSAAVNASLVLNLTNAGFSPDGLIKNLTSTTFQVNNSADVNNAGQTYVAYLFAHNAGGFGLTGTDNVISCGSYTGNGSATGPVITLGYEPQWVMVKRSNNTNSWYMVDTMRGFTVPQTSRELAANTSAAEAADYAGAFPIRPLATGFQPYTADNGVNGSGDTYIYIAIRRGPMKVPTSGTEVFATNTETEVRSNSSNWTSLSGFPVDLFVNKKVLLTDGTRFIDRLRTYSLTSSNTDAEVAAVFAAFDTNNGVKMGPVGLSGSSTTYADYLFRRAPSFFDVVCFTGPASGSTTQSHNLAAVPELIIAKCRSVGSYWYVYTATAGINKWLALNLSDAETTSSNFWVTAPTSTAFTCSITATGFSGGNVAYLFATVAGVSKVGSYTGTGTTQVINCGFTAGARFVLVKRTDSTGDWYVWDSARGIVSGNDPYLLLNSTAAEVTSTDYVDTASTGFEISSTAPAAINANGGTFIFLAIA